MENKIEKLSFDDLFHYPNSKIIYENNLWNIHSMNFITEEVKLFREVQYDVIIPEDIKYIDKEINITECKLQLRSVDQLIYSEMKICHDIIFWNYDGKINDEIKIIIGHNDYKNWNCGLSKIDRDLIDFLCGISVCIHPEMFNNGKAVMYKD